MDPMGNGKNPMETPYLMVKTMVSGVDFPITHSIHGAGIYANMTGVYSYHIYQHLGSYG